MSKQQRGRKVAPKKKDSSLQTFYWVVGVVAIVGIVVIVLYATSGNKSSASQETPAEEPTIPITSQSPQAHDNANDPADSATNDPARVFEVSPPSPNGTVAVGGVDGFYATGDADAPVTVIEFSDFECPACAHHATQIVPQLKQNYIESGKVQLVFHDFPLSYHTRAPIASAASRCAGEQGKFWDMHDALFRNRQQWVEDSGTTVFSQLADDIGADAAQFDACIESGKHMEKISASAQASAAAGINATPTFVVNGKAVEISNLFNEIDTALAEAGE